MLHIEHGFYNSPTRNSFTTGIAMIPRTCRGNMHYPRDDHRGSLEVVKSWPGMMDICVPNKTSCVWPKTSIRAVRSHSTPVILIAATMGNFVCGSSCTAYELRRTQDLVSRPSANNMYLATRFPIARRLGFGPQSKRLWNRKHKILIGSRRSGLRCDVVTTLYASGTQMRGVRGEDLNQKGKCGCCTVCRILQSLSLLFTSSNFCISLIAMLGSMS